MNNFPGQKKISRRSFLYGSAVLAAGLIIPYSIFKKNKKEGDWLSHGRNTFQTRYNEAENEISPSTIFNLKPGWKFEAQSGITATPAVVGNRIYFGSWDGNVYALNKNTGKLLWQYDTGTRIYSPGRKLGIYASSVFADDILYVVSGRILAILADTGELLWEKTIGDPATSGEYFWAAPLVADGRLYAAVSSGSETTARGRILCLDAMTGRELWTFFTVDNDVLGGSLLAPPSLDTKTGILYAATGNPFNERPGSMKYSCSLVALDAKTGKLIWADQVHPHDTRNLDLNCSPILVNVARRNLVVVGGKDGIRAWDTETRKRLWHRQLTPAISPGKKQAQPTNGPEGGPSAAAYGMVFFASNDNEEKNCILSAIDALTGQIKWSNKLPAFQFAPMSVAGGVIFMGLVDGTLRAWRAEDGKQLWISPVREPIAGGISISDGMIFHGTGAGEFLPGKSLYAYKLKSNFSGG